MASTVRCDGCDQTRLLSVDASNARRAYPRWQAGWHIGDRSRTQHRERAPDAGGAIEVGRRSMKPTSTHAFFVGAALDARSHRHDRAGEPAAHAQPRLRCWRNMRSGESRASRSHAFSAHKEFWGLPFQLSEATLVPRPDTETVVELALEFLRAGRRSRSPVRASPIIGTGSGAILLALLHEMPDALRRRNRSQPLRARTPRGANAAALGLAGRADFIACYYAAALARSVRSDRVESALYPLGGYCRD